MALGILTTTACNNANSGASSTSYPSWIGPSTPPSSSILPTASSDLEPQEKYSEVSIKVVYSDGSEDHNIRYYSNSPEIPYLGIKDYYKLLLKKTNSKEISDLTISTSDNINYTVTSLRQASIILNVKDNYLYSKHYSKFVNTSSFIKTGESTSYDGSPWLKIDEVTSNEISHPKYIDFDDYSIDIYGDKNDVYLPITTLGDIFSGMNTLYSSYNRKDLYIINGEANESRDTFPGYNDDLFRTTPTQDYMNFTYNEFCLFYDHLAGRPSRNALEKYYDLSYGLDKALDQRPLGRKIKECLKSTDTAKYIIGLQILSKVLHDGGHTRINPSNNLASENSPTGFCDWVTDDLMNRLTTMAQEMNIKSYEEISYANQVNDIDHVPSYARYFRKDALQTSTVSLRGTNTYHEKNDTAIISLDDFMGEIESRNDWIRYYNGDTDELPYDDTKGGVITSVYKGLQRAHANPNIKYVAIDIAGNSGGSSDELIYLISILTKDKELRRSIVIKNQLDNNITTTKFKIDRNLDRKFDEEDDNFDLVGDLNVFVVTSTYSYSCGGIAPIYLHDLGIPVVGDNSGGGSCAIFMYTDALGFQNRYSSPFNILSLKRHSGIDYERHYVCDYFIPHPDTTHPNIPKNYDGTDKVIGDYSNFFNLDYLSNLAKTVIFK